MKSPLVKVPFLTRIVATGPKPLSTLDSITIPIAKRLGLALYSLISAVAKIASNNLSTPSPVKAEPLMMMVEPPHSSAIKSRSLN
jgi:hypothetical protein